MPALQKKHKKSSVHNIKSVMNTRYGARYRTRIQEKPFSATNSVKFLINSSETIKHGTSQSSCFIRANTIKGQNKGKIKAHERTITQRKLHIASTKIAICRI